jgi:hypothetical protein
MIQHPHGLVPLQVLTQLQYLQKMQQDNIAPVTPQDQLKDVHPIQMIGRPLHVTPSFLIVLV